MILTEDILNDKSKFKPINGDWFKLIISLEDKLNRNLRKIKNKLTDVTYIFFIYIRICSWYFVWFAKKIINQDAPLGPFSLQSVPSIIIQQFFFVPILSNLTTNQFTIKKNSYYFIKELLDINISGTVFMASFDIKYLFTNIPLVETIDICVDHRKENLPYGLTVSQF